MWFMGIHVKVIIIKTRKTAIIYSLKIIFKTVKICKKKSEES